MAPVNPGTDPVDVLIKRLDPGLPLPARSHPGDAGVDLVAAVDVDLAPGERAVVPTGMAIALPDGYAAFVHPRSGLAAKHGVTIVNAPGTVDAGYRGEIRVTLLNTDRGRGSLVPARRPDRAARHPARGIARCSTRWTACPGQPGATAGSGPPGGTPAPPRLADDRRGPPGSSPAPHDREQGERTVFRRRRREEAEPEAIEDEAPEDAEDLGRASGRGPGADAGDRGEPAGGGERPGARGTRRTTSRPPTGSTSAACRCRWRTGSRSSSTSPTTRAR